MNQQNNTHCLTRLRKLLPLLIILFCSACSIIYGLYHIIYSQIESSACEQSYELTAQYVTPVPANNANHKTISTADTQVERPFQDTVFPKVDFEALEAMNSDIVGWIQIDETKINYPIVQGENNSYYLSHLYDKKSNSAGCIYLDYRNKDDFSDRNNVIYGHYVRNGSMFGDLHKYKESDYSLSHPTFQIMTPTANFVVEIFAVSIVSVYEDGWRMTFDDDQAFEDWLAFCIDKSIVDMGVNPTKDDRVVTLSTCTYESGNSRLLIYGIIHEIC